MSQSNTNNGACKVDRFQENTEQNLLSNIAIKEKNKHAKLQDLKKMKYRLPSKSNTKESILYGDFK